MKNYLLYPVTTFVLALVGFSYIHGEFNAYTTLWALLAALVMAWKVNSPGQN